MSAATMTPPCGYQWCRNDRANHVEHYGDGATTGNYSGPKSAEVECSAYVTTDSGGPYPDEIHLHIKTRNPGSDHTQTIDQGVSLFLTDDEAREPPPPPPTSSGETNINVPNVDLPNPHRPRKPWICRKSRWC